MKIQSKLRLKQGEKRLGEDIAKNINKIKVGDLVKVKKYGWIMRVDDIKGDLFYLENSKKGFDLSGKSGNAGSYYINEIQKIDNISGANQSDVNKSDLLNKWNKILDKLNSDLKKPTISKLEKTLIRNDIYRVKNAIKDLKKGISGKGKGTKRTKGSNYHKDTKSHNVNIRVISGLKLKYKIFQGYDWKNAKYIYHVVGINNDYVGEWHTLKRDAQKELKYLSKKVVGGIYKRNG